MSEHLNATVFADGGGRSRSVSETLFEDIQLPGTYVLLRHGLGD